MPITTLSPLVITAYMTVLRRPLVSAGSRKNCRKLSRPDPLPLEQRPTRERVEQRDRRRGDEHQPEDGSRRDVEPSRIGTTEAEPASCSHVRRRAGPDHRPRATPYHRRVRQASPCASIATSRQISLSMTGIRGARVDRRNRPRRPDWASRVAAMTLDEKASMTAGVDMWTTQAIERLGIPSWRLTDGPNGARGETGRRPLRRRSPSPPDQRWARPGTRSSFARSAPSWAGRHGPGQRTSCSGRR